MRDMGDMPPVVQKMFGKGLAEAVLKYGIIALGYLHPFMLIIFTLYIFMVMAQLVTSEMDSGTIGFTLSKGISRWRLYINMGIVIYTGLGLLALSSYFSAYVGIGFFHDGKLMMGPFGALSWNLFLLMVLVTGYAAILAALSESGKRFYTYGGVLLLFFYLLSLVTALWKPLELLAPINPFTYYQPIAILMGGRMGLTKSVTILLAGLAMMTAGAVLFKRRDISSG